LYEIIDKKNNDGIQSLVSTLTSIEDDIKDL